MRKIEKIRVGSEIDTEIGTLKVKSYNGHIVWCDYLEINDDGDLEPAGERALTLSEIALEMRAFDGKNHHLIFEEVADGEV